MDKLLIVKRAVDRADPYGLLAMGAPDDEYDLESERIADALSGADSAEKIAMLAAEIFSRSFNMDFKAELFAGAAEEIRHEFDKENKWQ